jgi:phosphotransferase system HPr-like phosphotransfer protein
MVTKKIRLSTMTDIKTFVNYCTKFGADIDLIAGRYIVDAKSIMGIISLDLSHPIVMQIQTDDCDEFLADVDSFIVNE